MTLQNIAIIAAKNIDDSIAAKKTLNFAKNPIKGGKPANVSRAIVKDIAKQLFDFTNNTKSAKSLFVLFKYCFFNCIDKNIVQIDKLASI